MTVYVWNPRRRRAAVRLWAGLLVLLGAGFWFVQPGCAAEEASPAGVKQRSTYYTEEKVRAARELIRSSEWARTIRDRAVFSAERYVKLGYDGLWDAVPDARLPRSYIVHRDAGSPTHGKALDAYGAFPYQIDPLADPWKLTDPVTGYKYPTNDFAAYYRSGLNERGEFDPGRADRSLLVNRLYPEKGANWGVDDGFGWVDGQGRRFSFVAYYAHWGQWKNMIFNALLSLRDAYLYTGDAKYAGAGIVLLDRIADVYPSMDIAAFPNSYGFENADGGTGQGKIVGSILEPELAETFASAYDAFFPALQDDRADFVAFLRNRAAAGGLTPRPTAGAISKHIEDGILRQIEPAVRKAQIRGNFGQHQSALAMAAVVLDEPGTSERWIRYLFQDGDLVRKDGVWSVTGGRIDTALIDDIDRDGHGNEAGPNYNRVWLTGILRLGDILDDYDRNPVGKLYDRAKVKKMASAFIPLTLAGRYAPNIGDSGATGNPGVPLDSGELLRAFARYREPELAQAALLAAGGQLNALRPDLFMGEPEALLRDVAEAVRSQGALQPDSVNLTGYGFGVLRDGPAAEPDGQGGYRIGSGQRDLWMYYGRNFVSHAHRDSLQIGLHAYGLDLAPDMGYVSFTDNNPLRYFWESNTVAHNTVVVDRSKQEDSWSGLPLHFGRGRHVQWMETEAPKAYPQTELYRRTIAMVRVDEERSYMVDFFRIRGGGDHRYSFHGAEGAASAEGLALKPQGKGTYAGADVAYGAADYNRSSTSGFNYLTDVRRDSSPPDRFSVEWAVTDTWKAAEPAGSGAGAASGDVRLRLTMLGETDEVALADGRPPTNRKGNPGKLTFLLAARTGTKLESVFTAVLEPYRGQRFIRSVEPAAVTAGGRPVPELEARAVKVTLTDGRVDLIVSAMDPGKLYLVDGQIPFQGAFGVYSRLKDRPVFAYLSDGTAIGPEAQGIRMETSRLDGRIVDFTREPAERNTMTVEWTSPGSEDAWRQGGYVYVNNDYRSAPGDAARNAVYPLLGAVGGERGRSVLDVGNHTFIRGWTDPSRPDRGYRYDIQRGQTVRIPLSREREHVIYRDLPAGHWAWTAIYGLTDRGIVGGIREGEFAPENAVSRAEFAVLLGRALQLTPAGRPSAFADVPASAWYAAELAAAAEAGLIEGAGGGRFEPSAPVTREQMAVMLVRARAVKGASAPANGAPAASTGGGGYRDAGRISSWARSAIEEARLAGLMSGKAGGLFDPQGRASRAEAAQAVYNWIKP